MLLAVTLTIFVGFCLGVFGSGGSMLILPILVYIAQIPPPESVALSLLIVGTSCALGYLLNVTRGAADVAVAAVFVLGGIPGGWFGARFTHLVPVRMLLLSFAALMILIGIKMLAQPAKPAKAGRRRLLSCLAVGAVVGALTGFFGVGGGFIVVPALVLVGGLEMKSAIGTSLGIIALNCFAGLASQLWYVHLPVPFALWLVAAAGAGMAMGVALASRLGTPTLRRGFGGTIVLLGGCIVLKNLP